MYPQRITITLQGKSTSRLIFLNSISIHSALWDNFAILKNRSHQKRQKIWHKMECFNYRLWSKADVDAFLVLCGLNILLSMPESVITVLIHLPKEDEETGLCGLTKEMNNWDLVCSSDLRSSCVQWIQCSSVCLGRRLGFVGKHGMQTCKGFFPGRDDFVLVPMTNLISSS